MDEDPKVEDATAIDSPEDEPLPPPPSPEELEKAERLIRESRLQKMRGNKTVAGKLLEEAHDVAPGSVVVIEAIADDLVERRQTKAATELYKKALRIDPKNVSVERKYAECILGTMRYDDMMIRSDLDAATGKSAVLLSVLVPGLGQIVSGNTRLGLGLMAGWLGGWGIAWLIPDGLKGVLGLFGVKSGGAAVEFNGVVMIPLLLAAVCHLWAIFEAASKSEGRKRKPIDRPRPPVDKDFEL